MLGQRTMGRSLSTGRGATAAALERRAVRRRCLRPGYDRISLILQSRIPRGHSSDPSEKAEVPDRNALEHVVANPSGNLCCVNIHPNP